MSVVIPTTSGAGFIAQAGALGPYAPVRYFLPYYDHRVDPFVHSDTVVMNVSAADPTSATSVIGEVIYNISALNAPSPGSYVYSVTNKEFLASGTDALSVSGNGANKIVSASSFDSTSLVNLLNGRPLSNCISGTSITYQGGNAWLVNGYVSAAGNNANPYSTSGDRNRFFRVQSYGPLTSAAGGNARGIFKLRLPHSVGNFKFNKIALYAAKFLSNGTEDTSVAPVLFAIAVLKNPILKTTDSTNLNNFELDLELEFYSQGVASQISYLNNDYWNRFQGGLWTDAPGGIAIASLSAVPGSWQPGGRLAIAVGTGEYTTPGGGWNISTPHIRLTNDGLTNNYDFSYGHSTTDDALVLKSSHTSTTFLIGTSGYDKQWDSTTPYSWAKIFTGPVNGYDQAGLQFFNFSPVSGSHFSSITSTYGGYAENMAIMSNGITVYKTQVNDAGSYVKMVLGANADTAYQSSQHFLTVHGRALFAGSGTLSTLTVSGISNATYPVISACGYIEGSGFYTPGTITALGQIATTGNLATYGSFLAQVGPNWIDNVQFGTSAIFTCRPSFIQGLSATLASTSYFGSVAVSGVLTTNNYIQALGGANVYTSLISNGPLSVFDALNVTGRSTFSDAIVTPNISATNGYNEFGRAVRMGYWQTYTPTLTAYGGGSFSVVNTYCSYALVGQTIMVSFYFTGTFTGSVTTLDIPMPNSYVGASPGTIFSPEGSWRNGAGNNIMVLGGAAGSNTVNMKPSGATSTAFTAGTSTELRGLIIMPVV